MEVNIAKFNDTEVIVSVSGEINSSNADLFSAGLEKALSEHRGKNVLIDVKDLKMITSVGLRVILKLIKQGVHLRIINVRQNIYEIFEMTGFTELMPVDRPIRRIVLEEDAVVMGRGANSTVYKTQNDLVVKVLRDGYDEDAIRQELDKTRRAFVMGIPTVIPYAIVEVDGKTGVAFELLEAKSLSKLLAEDASNLEKYIDMYVNSVKQFHAIEAEETDRKILSDAAAQIRKYRKDLDGFADPEVLREMDDIIDAFAVGNTIVHGDVQPCNVMVTDDTMLYIDMDTLSYGNPEFDLAYLYNALVAFSFIRPIRDFIGISDELAAKLWNQFIRRYFDTDDEAFIETKERLYKTIAYCRLYRWTLRHAADRPACIEAVKKAFEDAVREYHAIG